MTPLPLSPTITMIVAASRNGVIGRDGSMPWRLPSDLKRFKAITLGHPVIMGRKTFESIGKALPGRPNLVVTSHHLASEGVESFTSPDLALNRAYTLAERAEKSEIMIIGGGRLYAAFLTRAAKIYLTRVEAELKGDTFFPDLDSNLWKLESDELQSGTDQDDFDMRFQTFVRKAQ